MNAQPTLMQVQGGLVLQVAPSDIGETEAVYPGHLVGGQLTSDTTVGETMQGRSSARVWAVLAFVAVVVAVLVVQSTWWDANHTIFAQAAVSGLLIGGVYGLVAMGLSIVFGVLDIINFAHGALMTIGIYASYLLFQEYGVDPYLSLLVVVPLLFLVGAGIQRFAINPVMTAPVHNQLLLTLGIAIMIENLFLVVFTGTPRSIELPYAQRVVRPRVHGARLPPEDLRCCREHAEVDRVRDGARLGLRPLPSHPKNMVGSSYPRLRPATRGC